MDDGGLIAAIIAGIASLVTIFFGKQYWASFKKLLDGSQNELQRLRLQVEAMQVKLDTMERELHNSILERERLASRVYDYATRAQLLLTENEELRKQLAECQKKLVTLHSDRT